MNVHFLCSSSRWQKYPVPCEHTRSLKIFIPIEFIRSTAHVHDHCRGCQSKLRTKAKTNMAIFQHLKPLKRYTIFRINTNLKLHLREI